MTDSDIYDRARALSARMRDRAIHENSVPANGTPSVADVAELAEVVAELATVVSGIGRHLSEAVNGLIDAMRAHFNEPHPQQD